MASSEFAAEPEPIRIGLPMGRSAAWVAALAVVAAVAEIALDMATSLELDLASIYAIPLLLAAYTRRRLLLWPLALLLGIATLVVYALHKETIVPTLQDEVLFNRLLDVVALLVATSVLHFWMRSLDVRESQSRLLAEQNRRLETANRILLEHESQILRQNEELDRRNKDAAASRARMSQVLVAVSHDMRTPIQTIGLVAELMRRASENPALADRVPQMAQRLQSNAATLVTMASDLLDLARLDAGRADLKQTTFAFDELIASKCRDLDALAQAKSLTLVVHAPPAPLWINSDRGKLERVLRNLVGNAIKFTALGSITVDVGLDGSGSPALQVTDTGAGIEPEALNRIFDEYAQAGETEGATERGWGLGLAISRRLAQALGGKLEVTSEIGQGSIFTLTLPGSSVVDIAPLAIPTSAGPRPAN